jgi:hypothetical protein
VVDHDRRDVVDASLGPAPEALALRDARRGADREERLEQDAFFHHAVVWRGLDQLRVPGLEDLDLPTPDRPPPVRVLIHPVDAVNDVARAVRHLEHALLVRQLEDLSPEPQQAEPAHALIELLHEAEEPVDRVKLVGTHPAQTHPRRLAQDGLGHLERVEDGEQIRADREVIDPQVSPGLSRHSPILRGLS